MIELHIGAMVSISLMALVLSFGSAKPANRRLHTLVRDLAPFGLLALGSRFLLSSAGTPIVEWLLPAACTALMWKFCGTERDYRVGQLIAIVVSLFLFDSFTRLSQKDYITATGAKYFEGTRQRPLIGIAKAELARKFPDGKVIPAGFIAERTGNESLSKIEILEAEREWHTPFTFLYRRKSSTRRIWSPGGTLEEATKGLEFRP